MKKADDEGKSSKMKEKSLKVVVCSKKILQLTGKLSLAHQMEIGLIVICS